MKAKSQQQRRQLPEPPTANMHTRHALGLAHAADFLLSHWYSFLEIVPEDEQDGVEEAEISTAIQKVLALLQELAGHTAMRPWLNDVKYRRELAHLMQHAGYMPVEQLEAVRAMFFDAERRTDELPPKPSHRLRPESTGG